MFTSIQMLLVLSSLGLMAVSATVAHADASPPAEQTLTALQVMNQVSGIIYRKALPDGRTLSVSRSKLPPDPQTIKSLNEFDKVTKDPNSFPPGVTVEYPDYSWIYSFDVVGGKDKPRTLQKTLWTLRADHIPSRNYPEIDRSEIRMRDVALEGQALVLVFKQALDTYGFIILPSAKNGPQRLPRRGPSFRLAGDTDDQHGRVFTQTAKITGSYAKGTLGVDLIYTNGKQEHFDWKNEMWAKRSTAALPADTQAEKPAVK